MSALLEVEGSSPSPIKSGVFGRTSAHVRAVDGVDFHVKEGETLAGGDRARKSTVGRLVAPDRAQRRARCFEGDDLLASSRPDCARRRRLQDSRTCHASLNPRMTVGATALGEPLYLHHLVGNEAQRRARVGVVAARAGRPAP